MKKLLATVLAAITTLSLSACDISGGGVSGGDQSSSHTHTTVSIPAVEATCTETGLTKGEKCSTCYEIIVEQQIIPALGHEWSNYECKRCGIAQELILDPMKNDILTIQQIDWDINSAAGVEPSIKYTNHSSKQIAYIWFTIKFYDRMGSPAYCSIKREHTMRLKVTGPINAGQQKTGYWDPVVYNGSVAAIKPVSIEVEYTDGTKRSIKCTGRYWYSKSYYGGDLRD